MCAFRFTAEIETVLSAINISCLSALVDADRVTCPSAAAVLAIIFRIFRCTLATLAFILQRNRAAHILPNAVTFVASVFTAIRGF